MSKKYVLTMMQQYSFIIQLRQKALDVASPPASPIRNPIQPEGATERDTTGSAIMESDSEVEEEEAVLQEEGEGQQDVGELLSKIMEREDRNREKMFKKQEKEKARLSKY